MTLTSCEGPVESQSWVTLDLKVNQLQLLLRVQLHQQEGSDLTHCGSNAFTIKHREPGYLSAEFVLILFCSFLLPPGRPSWDQVNITSSQASQEGRQDKVVKSQALDQTNLACIQALTPVVFSWASYTNSLSLGCLSPKSGLMMTEGTKGDIAHA